MSPFMVPFQHQGKVLISCISTEHPQLVLKCSVFLDLIFESFIYLFIFQKDAVINRLDDRLGVTCTESFTVVFPLRSCTAGNVSHSLVTFLVKVMFHCVESICQRLITQLGRIESKIAPRRTYSLRPEFSDLLLKTPA